MTRKSVATCACRSADPGRRFAKQSLFTDHLGSVIAVADDGANGLTRTYAHDPDGNQTTSTSGLGGSNATSSLGYIGGFAPVSGLIHYGARYYDPANARWTQTDPVEQPADLAQANMYAYVGGDPINRVDPNGTSFLSSVGKVARGVFKVGKVAYHTVTYIGTCFAYRYITTRDGRWVNGRYVRPVLAPVRYAYSCVKFW